MIEILVRIVASIGLSLWSVFGIWVIRDTTCYYQDNKIQAHIVVKNDILAKIFISSGSLRAGKTLWSDRNIMTLNGLIGYIMVLPMGITMFFSGILFALFNNSQALSIFKTVRIVFCIAVFFFWCISKASYSGNKKRYY